MASKVVEVEGLEQLRAKLNPETMLGKPLHDALEKIGFLVEGGAKEKASVDQGRLRASVDHQVDQAALPAHVDVGTNVHYAPYHYYGRKPGSWPPFEPIREWAARHGIEDAAYAIQRKIGEEGIKPNPFLLDGAKAVQPQFGGVMDAAARDIEKQWGQ